MTRPRNLEEGDRVIFWRSLTIGPGKTPENPNPQTQGTVVSIEPLQVNWDNRPTLTYPMGDPNGYKRFEVKALPHKE